MTFNSSIPFAQAATVWAQSWIWRLFSGEVMIGSEEFGQTAFQSLYSRVVCRSTVESIYPCTFVVRRSGSTRLEEDAWACLKFSDCDLHEDARSSHCSLHSRCAPKSGAGAQPPLSCQPHRHFMFVVQIRLAVYDRTLFVGQWLSQWRERPPLLPQVPVAYPSYGFDLYCSCFRGSSLSDMALGTRVSR